MKIKNIDAEQVDNIKKNILAGVKNYCDKNKEKLVKRNAPMMEEIPKLTNEDVTVQQKTTSIVLATITVSFSATAHSSSESGSSSRTITQTVESGQVYLFESGDGRIASKLLTRLGVTNADYDASNYTYAEGAKSIAFQYGSRYFKSMGMTLFPSNVKVIDYRVNVIERSKFDSYHYAVNAPDDKGVMRTICTLSLLGEEMISALVTPPSVTVTIPESEEVIKKRRTNNFLIFAGIACLVVLALCCISSLAKSALHVVLFVLGVGGGIVAQVLPLFVRNEKAHPIIRLCGIGATVLFCTLTLIIPAL